MKQPLLTIVLAPPGTGADELAKNTARTQRLNAGPPEDLMPGRLINLHIRRLNETTLETLNASYIKPPRRHDVIEMLEIERQHVKDDKPRFAHNAACILRTVNQPARYKKHARPGIIYDPYITILWPLWQYAIKNYLTQHIYHDEIKYLVPAYSLITAPAEKQKTITDLALKHPAIDRKTLTATYWKYRGAIHNAVATHGG